MALILDTRYPGRMAAANASYPRGSFKNRSAPGALDGSYIERDWANDWNGFFSALLANAGITANGNVDTALSSQYYTAFQSLIAAGVPYATVAETLAGIITNKAVNPAGLQAVRMRRIARVTTSTVQTLPGTTLGPDPIVPLNVNFTADGGMYTIIANIKTLIDGSGSNVDQIFQTRLRNGSTVLDIGAMNNDGSFASQRYSLGWSGVLTGAVTLNVVLQRSIGSGLFILNADQHAGTNTTGQESWVDVYRMGA